VDTLKVEAFMPDVGHQPINQKNIRQREPQFDRGLLMGDGIRLADTSTEPPARITNLVLASKTAGKPAPKTAARPPHKKKKTAAKKAG
jgi:hypothetical protein